jgi:hypothetical protein
VEAPRIELGSKNQCRRTLHACSLLFPIPTNQDKNSLTAESVKRQDLGKS